MKEYDLTYIARLLTDKNDLGATYQDNSLESANLDPNQVRLKVDKFALTTNNITYAACGDQIGYWQVFPTGIDGKGAMPVWGFAEVVQSRADKLEEGARIWGFLPIASEVVVEASNVTPRGFVDIMPNRAAVPGIYSRYMRCDSDPQYRRDLEACQAIYRPLFITSYTTVDFVRENYFFGAKRIVISSASSKTAYGIAWSLRDVDMEVVGITSARNRAFVTGLGCYDKVIDYEEIETLPDNVPVLYIDLSSNPSLRERIHVHLGGALMYDCLVGATQGSAFPAVENLPGPAPQFFFAAERLDQHRAQGTMHAFIDRFTADQLSFFDHVTTSDPAWINISEAHGLTAAAAIIRDLADGRSDPGIGHMVAL